MLIPYLILLDPICKSCQKLSYNVGTMNSNKYVSYICSPNHMLKSTKIYYTTPSFIFDTLDASKDPKFLPIASIFLTHSSLPLLPFLYLQSSPQIHFMCPSPIGKPWLVAILGTRAVALKLANALLCTMI